MQDQSRTGRTEKIALFVDVENFIGFSRDLGLPIDLAPVIKRLTETGRVLFRRSFGDLSQALYATGQINRMRYVREMLQRNLVQHEDVPYDNRYKNSSDIRLAIEALSTAFGSPDITTFAIVSGDRDYIPLFSKLRELGKDVTGISGSPATVGERYVIACDAVFYVEDLYRAETGLLPEVAEGAQTDSEAESETYLREQYVALLVRAVSLLSEQGRRTIDGELAPRLRQLQSDFDPGRVGFASFREFLDFAAERGAVFVTPQGADVLVTLTPPAASPEPPVAPAAVSPTPIRLPSLRPAEPMRPASVAEYRRFVEDKLRQPLPSRDQRRRIYETAAQMLESSTTPISLSDLSHDVGDRLMSERVPVTQKAVFKVLYSLHRAKCFIDEAGRSTYDPQIHGINYSPESWDERFIFNSLILMNREMRGAPFDAANLSLLFYESEAEAEHMADKLDSMRMERV